MSIIKEQPSLLFYTSSIFDFQVCHILGEYLTVTYITDASSVRRVGTLVHNWSLGTDSNDSHH